MVRILLGFVYALVASVGFSFFASLVICGGADPEARAISDAAVPLLGIFTGAWLVSRAGEWRTGLGIGLVYAVVWFAFWMYLMGRWSLFLWIEEGLPRLTLFHFVWWALALLAGVGGGVASQIRWGGFVAILGVACAGLSLAMAAVGRDSSRVEALPGFQVERIGAKEDQTVVYTLTFDFNQQSQFKVGLYDCDDDDAYPHDDSNTSYMGQSLIELVGKLGRRGAAGNQQLLCAINGGFFGASGFSVAHHEDPIVQDDVAYYDVDLLRPREQSWLFAVNAPASVTAGHPRFSMLPAVPWPALGSYQTVLGGVRPLCVDGKSVPLEPGAGATKLKCSRTSVGWSADGNRFYILIVHDPESEGSSQLQRRMGWYHEGGWDVRDVQRFWEEKHVPFALLFDGGESTQLAYRDAGGGFHDVASGYQYSATLGYFFHRPLLLTLPILPPSEGHRGVLNYLYVAGPEK